jgi:hypothetical protein
MSRLFVHPSPGTRPRYAINAGSCSCLPSSATTAVESFTSRSPLPTAAWTAQQFREAFRWDQAPRYLIHDRDLAYQAVTATARARGIQEVRAAARSPWQNAYFERFIGSVRRACLDHIIVRTAGGLRTILKNPTSPTTWTRERTSRSARTRPSHDRSADPMRGELSPVRKSAGSITGTNAARHRRFRAYDSAAVAVAMFH